MSIIKYLLLFIAYSIELNNNIIHRLMRIRLFVGIFVGSDPLRFFKKLIRPAGLQRLRPCPSKLYAKTGSFHRKCRAKKIIQLNGINYISQSFSKNILITGFFLASITLQASHHDQFTIMIDPAGDAKHTGRLIQDTLERGISLQCAEQLKAMLSQKFKNVRVILTRVPGETIQPLQNASFANRLGVDLYVSLYFYHEPETPAHVTLYHYLENPIIDFWHQPIVLSFYQVNQAHLLNLKVTQAWGKIILEVLQDTRCSKFFKARGLFGIPFTPLVGIKAPAIAIEVGLKNKQDWQQIIDPIVIAIERIMI